MTIHVKEKFVVPKPFYKWMVHVQLARIIILKVIKEHVHWARVILYPSFKLRENVFHVSNIHINWINTPAKRIYVMHHQFFKRMVSVYNVQSIKLKLMNIHAKKQFVKRIQSC